MIASEPVEQEVVSLDDPQDPLAGLERLARLRASGALTEDEFQTEKSRLMRHA
jgi:hypothetical protein